MYKLMYNFTKCPYKLKLIFIFYIETLVNCLFKRDKVVVNFYFTFSSVFEAFGKIKMCKLTSGGIPGKHK